MKKNNGLRGGRRNDRLTIPGGVGVWPFVIFVGCYCLMHESVSHAQFNPETLSHSVVRILVKNSLGVIGSATGFLWKSDVQVVTSLHVLSNDPSSRVIVEFGKVKRLATIEAVLPEADLVMLSVDKPVAGWVPLHEFEKIKPPYQSRVSAMGFNQGALGMSTRELIKGYVNPEILKVLLPPLALNLIVRAGVLNINLPIYYLDGSLLPGYSGAPVVNAQGQLIGIGDGGLENGASSVSWVIPANQLLALEQSKVSQLPVSLDYASQVFSLDRFRRVKLSLDKQGPVVILNDDNQIPAHFLDRFLESVISSAHASSGGHPVSTEVIAWDSVPLSTEVNYRDFNFVKVKSRSYEQLLSTSDAPDHMNKVFTLLNQFLPGYQLDFKHYEFDIYEDGRFGLNIAVPKGVVLKVDRKGFLVAEGAMFCRRCDYEIQYHARQFDNKSRRLMKQGPMQFLHGVADQHWQDLNDEGDYGEYSSFREIEKFGAARFVLRAAFSDFEEPFKSKFELNYFTAATNRDSWFQAQGILNRFDNKFFKHLKQYQGTDCLSNDNNPQQVALCTDIDTMLKVLISVHLTSFSNKLYALN